MIKLSLRKKLLLFIAMPVAICTIVIVVLSSIKINQQGISNLIDKSNAILGLNILEFTRHHYEGSTIVEMNIENSLKGVTSKIGNEVFNYEFRISSINPINEKHKPINGDLNYIEQFRTKNINELIELDKSNNKLLVVRPVFMNQEKGCTDCHVTDFNETGSNNLKGIFILKSDLNQVKNEVNASILQNSIAGIIIILSSLLFAYILSRSISKPIVAIKDITEQLAIGNINQNFEYKSQDEIGAIALAFKKLLLALKKIAEFSNEIGKGNYATNYTLLGENDTIGKSLINMRNNLEIAKEKEIERKKKEEEESWINQGIAEFNNILRQQNKSINELSYLLISNLVEYVGAIQGGLFVINNSDEDNIFYEMTGAVAYGRQKLLENKFELGEGLVGKCAFEKLPIYMEEVPEDYITINSGLGTANPQSILLVPAILDDKVYAIIELASFEKFMPYKIGFIEKLANTIASTISSVKTTSHTQQLLEESKKQSEELAAQEEEMRQNLEELQATQEELLRLRKQEEEETNS